MATVKHRVGPNGDHELGVEDDGTFVVFTSMTQARYDQLNEAEVNRGGGSKAKGSGSRSSKAKAGEAPAADES